MTVSARRSRRFETWAAAVAARSAPHADVAAADGAGGRGPGGLGSGLAELARRELAELVVAGREAVAERLAELGQPDPARKHAKQVRRAERKVRVQTTVAVGFAGLTGVAAVASAPEVADVGLGAVALLAGAAAVRAGRRLSGLRRQPPPPPRSARPPKDSPARSPLDRLAAQEQTLHVLLGHLGEAAAEPRRVAASAAAGLRDLGARLTAVHRAHRVSGGLHDAVEALRRQLDAGIAAYDTLVVAAADAVAADAGLRTPAPSLQEATDSLAGLAAGLRAVA
jgi:hypothetical protein